MIPKIEKAQPRPDNEPSVRIGIVLAEDARTTLRMEVPDSPYELGADGHAPVQAAGRKLTARLEGGAVALQVGDDPPRTAPCWHIVPRKATPLTVGAGVTVHDIVAGRGFHWQKDVTQTLTGVLEIHSGRGGLVLVNALPLEEYLAGVITAEMGGGCPLDLLKAQGVVARGWLLAATERKHEGEPFLRCNDDCCQRYQGTDDLSPAAVEVARSTRGEVLIAADGSMVDANYSKCCGGISELPEHVWGVNKPGLSVVVDAPKGSAVERFHPLSEDMLDEFLDGDWVSTTDIFCSPNVVPPDKMTAYLGRVDEPGDYFRWTVNYTRGELETLLKKRMPELAEMAALADIRVTDRGVSGRASEVTVDWEDAKGLRHAAVLPDEYRIREVLHDRFLYSSAIVFRIARDATGRPEKIALRGAGWGHGAGLCQIGALGMALEGYDYREIVAHYFPDAKLERIYD